MSDFDRLLNALQQNGYHQWMKSEGIPVAVGHGMEDVRDIKLAPWRRTGGLGITNAGKMSKASTKIGGLYISCLKFAPVEPQRLKRVGEVLWRKANDAYKDGISRLPHRT